MANVKSGPAGSGKFGRGRGKRHHFGRGPSLAPRSSDDDGSYDTDNDDGSYDTGVGQVPVPVPVPVPDGSLTAPAAGVAADIQAKKDKARRDALVLWGGLALLWYLSQRRGRR